MGNWRSRRTLILGLAMVTMFAAGAVAGLFWLWQSSEEPVALHTDRSVEESLLDGALAEIDRPILQARYQDDLDSIIKRRVIRILTTYNKTNFFIDDGRLRGFEYELLQQYRAHLKTRVRKRSWPTVFLFIPLPFDELLPALAEGRGDIAAAGLTITPEREQLVAFTTPYIRGVEEILVTAEGVSGLERIEDLSGRSIYVNLGTSYAQSLDELNAWLGQQGRAPVTVVPADPGLATEDILELVNAGVIEITVADKHIAELWAQALPKIVLRPELTVRRGGQIAWAVRKDNPELLKSLNYVIPRMAKGTMIGNVLFKNYFQEPAWIESPLADGGAERLARLAPLFQKYAERYDFDWLKIAALAYRESRLDNTARSRRGAVGIMQVLPATAEAPPVGISNVRGLEDNIHAGVKYLAHLRDRYFDDPAIEPAAQSDFALAAYNAGPTRISKLRSRAKREGFDPNRWFSHVEQVARRAIGRETVDYVADINKYYVAYKLSAAALTDRARSREAVARDAR